MRRKAIPGQVRVAESVDIAPDAAPVFDSTPEGLPAADTVDPTKLKIGRAVLTVDGWVVPATEAEIALNLPR